MLSMVISNEFCNDNFRMYLRFQTDDDRKVNCSYSGIIRNDNKQKEQCDRRCRDRMVEYMRKLSLQNSFEITIDNYDMLIMYHNYNIYCMLL
jgi:hypothetical protein